MENEINEMVLDIIKTALNKLDPKGFLSYLAEILAKNEMPVQNIPKYLQEMLKWFETHDPEENEKPSIPKVSFDSEELKRLMRSEMNDD